MFTKVMGILNVTPDSFSDGGEYRLVENALSHALAMERDGAAIIDVGGESTRPGSLPVSMEEELSRVLPVIRSLRSRLTIPISIDTRKAIVALRACEEGATMINDISAGSDPEMFDEAVVECRLVILITVASPRHHPIRQSRCCPCPRCSAFPRVNRPRQI